MKTKILSFILVLTLLVTSCVVLNPLNLAAASEASPYVGKTVGKSMQSVTMLDKGPISELGKIYGVGANHSVDFDYPSNTGTLGLLTGFVHDLNQTDITASLGNGRNYNASINSGDKAVYIKSKQSESDTSFYGSNYQNYVSLYEINNKTLWTGKVDHIIEFDVKADNYYGDFGILGHNLWGNSGLVRILYGDPDNNTGYFRMYDKGNVDEQKFYYTAGKWYRLRMEYSADTFNWNVYITDESGIMTHIVRNKEAKEKQADWYYSNRFSTKLAVMQKGNSEGIKAGFTVDNFRHIAGTAVDFEGIIAPVGSLECVEDNIKLQAVVTGADKAVFKLDGKVLEEFEIADSSVFTTLTTHLKMEDSFYGPKNFTVEKQDSAGNVIGTVMSEAINLIPMYKDFIKINRPLAGESPLVSEAYATKLVGGETQYGYPRTVNTYSTGSTSQSAWMYQKTGTGCDFTAASRNGSNDCVLLQQKTAGAAMWSTDTIQFLYTGEKLDVGGDIIEIKYDIKVIPGSRVCLTGISNWNGKGSNLAADIQFIVNDHIRGTSAPLKSGEWVTVRMLYDTVAKNWNIYTQHEGEAMMTKAIENLKADTDNHITDDNSYLKTIGLSPTNSGVANLKAGFYLDNVSISRLIAAPKLTGIEFDSVPVPAADNRIPSDVKKIKLTFDRAYDTVVASDISFKVGNIEKAVSNLTVNGTSYEFEVPSKSLKDGDYVELSVLGTSILSGLISGVKIGASYDAYYPVINSISKGTNAGNKELTADINTAKIPEDKILALLCVYDEYGALVSLDTEFIQKGVNTSEMHTLTAPNEKITQNSETYFYIMEGDYKNIAYPKKIDW